MIEHRSFGNKSVNFLRLLLVQFYIWVLTPISNPTQLPLSQIKITYNYSLIQK